MADAYDIMSYAKRSGAQAQQQEDWQKYQDELAAFQEKEGKANFWGGLATIAAGIAMPALLPALASGAGLGSMAMMGAVRGLGGHAIGEMGRSMAGGGGGQPTYKATGTGPYGRAGAKAQQRQADVISRGIAGELKGGERNRLFQSMMSGFMPEFKKGGVGQEKLKRLLGGKGAPPGTNIVDGMASIRMPSGEVYGSAPAPPLQTPGFLEAGGKGSDILSGIKSGMGSGLGALGSGIGAGIGWGGQAGKSMFDLLWQNQIKDWHGEMGR